MNRMARGARKVSGRQVGDIMRKRRHYMLRRFKCTVCGAETTATKHTVVTGKGHIKTMYCYVCCKETDFIQTDIDKTK